MPTGYTADVRDGTITDFPTFALRCARAFGATLEMRDEPLDADIPESFQPRIDYHDRQIAKAQAELARFDAMTDADKARAASEAWAERVARIDDMNAGMAEERARYEAMLEQARAWRPPTSAHVGLKEFMIQQLEQSIEFDCAELSLGPRPSPAMWWIEHVEEAHRSIAYHTREREEAIQRAREQTAWLRHLRASLDQMETVSR